MQPRTVSLILASLMIATAGLPLGSAQLSTTAVVGNLVPTVQDIDVPAVVNPTAGGATTVNVTVTVADGNGHQDLVGVTVSVLQPDGTTVHRAPAAAVSNDDGSGVAKTYAYSFVMQFYDAPATGNASYKVHATVTDAKGAVSVPLTVGFSYTPLTAMSLSGSSLGFGSIDPGVRSSVASLTVTNQGNTLLDLETSGTGLSDGAGHEIAVDRIKYDLAHSDLSGEASLTADPTTNAFGLAFGPSSAQATYWQLDTPSGEEQYLPAGTYSGTITVSAVQG